MRRTILAWAAALALAGPAAAQPAHAPLSLQDPLGDKVFYLFRLIERSPEAKAAIQADAQLAALRNAYVVRLVEADRACASQAPCYGAAAKLKPDEVAWGEAALRRLYASSPAVRRLADQDLPASGIVGPGQGADLLAAAWREEAEAAGRIVDTFALGLPPLAPAIDSPADAVTLPAYGQKVRLANALVVEKAASPSPFYKPLADYAEALLWAEGRDEAGRHESLEVRENAAAVKRMKGLDWKRWPYAAILVPGFGPERDGERLTGVGRLRTELAVLRWRAGKAPFLILSGGYAHPARTPFAEAIEMRRYAVEVLHVPEDAILVDPQARHTTTNIRNAARILWRDGAPAAAKMLIVTDEAQTAYIASSTFDDINRRDTGVLPYVDKIRLGRFEVEAGLTPEALRLNPKDPLDP